MIGEFESVVLAVDLSQHGLRGDDLGTVVLTHAPGGYEVEFVWLDGETIAVVSLTPDQLRRVGRYEIAHVRTIEAA